MSRLVNDNAVELTVTVKFFLVPKKKKKKNHKLHLKFLSQMITQKFKVVLF